MEETNEQKTIPTIRDRWIEYTKNMEWPDGCPDILKQAALSEYERCFYAGALGVMAIGQEINSAFTGERNNAEFNKVAAEMNVYLKAREQDLENMRNEILSKAMGRTKGADIQ
jgi:hypothetical protein